MKRKINVTLDTEQYIRLLADGLFLTTLETCGVSEWDGYAKALAEYNKDIRSIIREEATQ